MKVKGREAGETRQCLQLDRIVEMLGDVFDCRLHGSTVEGASVGLHPEITVRGGKVRRLISLADFYSSANLV
jgi:hypothetical protein